MRHSILFTTCCGLFLLAGLAVISTAWGFQLIGGYEPCALCLEQRTPYYVALPLSLLALVTAVYLNYPLVARVLLLIAGCTMIYGAGLAVYHAGVEWSIWSGPSACSGGDRIVDNASDLKSALMSTRVVSCTEASWRLFGLSFAGWNAVASLGLAIIAYIGFRNFSAKDVA